jgi:hypothetical protein
MDSKLLDIDIDIDIDKIIMTDKTITKSSWDMVLKWHKTPPDYMIGRNPEVELIYQNALLSRTRENYIHHIKTNVMESKTIQLAINSFPYYLADEIQHYCLWIDNPDIIIDDTLIQLSIFDKLGKWLIPGIDISWFINLPKNKSIPEIQHAHVFIRMA